LTKQISVMKQRQIIMKTTPIIGQKSGRGERVLWKPDFVLCVIPFFDFYKS
jgi:hypothetical protein